jgi:putative inorganic carbon (hco3(-)) transporter
VLDTLINDGGIKLVLLAACGLVGGLLAVNRSTYLVDFFMVVACTNRFLRRLIDWSEGSYDPQPLTSLATPLIATMAVLAVALYFNDLNRTWQRVAVLCGAAVGYAFLLGVMQPRAAIYGLLLYITSFGMMLYAALVQPNRETYLRWLRLIGLLGIGVAVYGVFQWATIPPWDAFWLESSGMHSMGRAEAYQMNVFSTLESRGPFAFFMAVAAIPLICLPQCRRYFGLPGVAVLLLGALLSTARTSWGFIVLGVLCYVLLSGGQGIFRVALIAALLAATAAYALPMLPESERITDRVETLTELSEDSSFQGRIGIAQNGLWKVLAQPWGYGLGATGMGASKLAGQAVIGDNGFLMLLAEFGFPGCLALALAFKLLMEELWRLGRVDRSPPVSYALALFLAALATLVISNWLDGPYAGMIFIAMAGALMSEQVEHDELAEDDYSLAAATSL